MRMLAVPFLMLAVAGTAGSPPPVPASSLAAAGRHPADIAGTYDGGQHELAASLELRGDGRFSYALSYGALDEAAQGAWEFDGSQVVLTGDPLIAPRFALVPGRMWPAPKLTVLLDVPQGMSRQFFRAHIAMADGRTLVRQLGADGLTLALGPKERPLSVAMELELYGVRGAPVILARGRGGEVHFRFEPNDLGKVAFEHTPLRRDGDGWLLFRHGRSLQFRRRSD